MSSLTLSQARDEILAVFKATWDTTGLLALYDDIPGVIPSTTTSWARVTLRFTGGNQASLARINGQSRWQRFGTIIIQIFTPIGGGVRDADTLAELVVKAFEGITTPGDVWFRNVGVQFGEIAYRDSRDGDWLGTNVSAQFQFDEIH